MTLTLSTLYAIHYIHYYHILYIVRYATHWNDQTFYKVSTGVKVGGVTQYEQVGVSVRNFIATHVSITTTTTLAYY